MSFKSFFVRRDYIVNRLNKMNGVNCDIPGGAFYVFPDFKAIIQNNNLIKCSDDLCMYLLEKKSLVSVSGKAFGSNGNIRFSYAASDKDLEQAMNLVEESLKELQ